MILCHSKPISTTVFIPCSGTVPFLTEMLPEIGNLSISFCYLSASLGAHQRQRYLNLDI